MSSSQLPRPIDPALPPHAEASEAIGIVFVCFGFFIANSCFAMAGWRPGTASGWSDNGFTEGLALELILGATALLLLWGRTYPLRTLVPRPTWRGVFEGGLVAVCALLASSLVKYPLPHYATTPVAEMLAATHVSWSSTVPAMVVNGLFEEVFLLGYLMRGLRRLGASTALGIALLVRLLYHTYQGPVGVAAVMAIGLVFGAYFLRRGGLFPVVLAHVVIDLIVFLTPWHP